MRKIKRVALVDPNSANFKVAARTWSPIGAGYLSAVLENVGIGTDIIYMHDSSIEDLVMGVEKFNPDVVAVCSVFTSGSKRVLALTEKIKEKMPKATIIAGGDHPSIWPRFVENPTIDYVGVGMGELVLPDFIRFLNGEVSISEVPGLGYLKDGKVVLSPVATLNDLNELPFPLRGDFSEKMYSYFPSEATTKGEGKAYVNMRASVGCNKKCSWCYTWKLFPDYVRRSIENIKQELEQLSNNHNIGFLDFLDANLVADRNWFLELCKTIKEFSLPWRMFAHPHQVDDEILQIASDAGCRTVFYGLDSFDDRELQSLKGITLENFSNILKTTHEHGIYTVVSFMLGQGYETKDTIEMIVKYFVKNPPVRLYPTFLTDFQKELKNGTDPNLLDTNHPLYATKGLSVEQLDEAKRYIQGEVYNSGNYRKLRDGFIQRYGNPAKKGFEEYNRYLRELAGLNIRPFR